MPVALNILKCVHDVHGSLHFTSLSEDVAVCRFRRVFRSTSGSLATSTSTPSLNRISHDASPTAKSQLKKSLSRFSFLLASDEAEEDMVAKEE